MSSSNVTVTAHRLREVELITNPDAHATQVVFSITVQGAIAADHHVLVSRIIAADHGGWETMIFFWDEKTEEVESWMPVSEGQGYEEIEESVSNYIKTVATCYNNPKESSS
tara:strand:+ start:94 stop:426 length:333 start_codon:yes stop_codon:yes gene_type:complete